MAHEDTPGIHSDGGMHSSAPMIFSEAEQQRFWQDDKAAATAVVGLMAGIFAIGLLGYICVALWVASWSNYWS
jgi:hypothetical protein